MTLWLNTFCISFPFFMLAYLSSVGLLSDIPTLFVLIVIGMTFLRILYRTRMIVAGPIAKAFALVALMALFFFVKQVIQSGVEGAALALKILMYHLVFLAGLLLGYYDPPAPSRRARLYAGLLFFLPLVFFVLFAQGQSPSSALSVFNRNSFAGFTLTASALLLGAGTGRQLVSLSGYVVIVSLALLINTTLGALLAFLLAVVLYIGPKALINRRIMAAIALLCLVGVGVGVYLSSNPNVLQGVEVINRMRFISGVFSNLFTHYEGSWLELDMATAVRFAPSGELDMSAVFRLVHWNNILNIMASEGPGSIWIGGGTDWIQLNESRFTYTLAAHNEYVRLTVEQGLAYTLIIFIGLYVVAYGIRRNPLFIPMFATTLYLGSENLLNNFVVTAMYFFFFAHTFASERRRQASGPTALAHVVHNAGSGSARSGVSPFGSSTHENSTN